MAATICPHCGVLADMIYFPKHGAWSEPLLSWMSPSRHQWLSSQQSHVVEIVNEIDGRFTVPAAEGGAHKWKMALCRACGRPVFVVLDQHEDHVVRTFPPTSLDRPAGIPDGVADDYVEARLCLSVGAHKAAVAMCRRALQAAALDKKCKRADLIKQLDDLGDKGLLNPSLLEIAHQVRHFGNYGSHPDRDGLGSITKDEAETIQGLTWQVLEDVYVNPERVKAMKAALARKKARRARAPEPVAEEAESSASREG